MKSEYYIYLLFRPDGRPCYIGKGKKSRWTSHERNVKNGHKLGNPHLENIIKNAPNDLPKVKLAQGLSEEKAFELEALWIKTIGREIHGGPLVNQTEGGEGVSGLKMPPHIGQLAREMHTGNAYRLGVPVSEATRELMRQAKLGTKRLKKLNGKCQQATQALSIRRNLEKRFVKEERAKDLMTKRKKT